MTISNRPGRGLAGAHAWFAHGFFLLIAMLGLGWSQQAAASLGCDIQDTSVSATQSGPASTITTPSTLTYSFDIVDMGGCSGTQSGNISNTFDNTGGASSNPTTWSGVAGQTITVTITLGNTGGGTSTWQVDCTAGCGFGTVINWTANTDDQFSLTADPPTSFNLLEGQVATLNAHYFRNGNDNFDSTIWTVDDPSGFLQQSNPVFTDDNTGLVTNGFYSYTPGNYTITVEGNPSECGALCPQPVFYNITVETAVLTPDTPAGGTATIPHDSAITLIVDYSGPSLPAVDGTNIEWRVSTEPNPGVSAIFTGAFPNPPFGSQYTTQTTGGKAQVELNVTVAGTYVVDACYAPDGCSGSPNDNTQFTITVTPADADLSVTKTDSPDPVIAGDQLTYTITAHNAGPDTATAASMDDVLPAPLTFVSLSSPGGWTCSTPAVGNNGTISCTNPSFTAGGADPVFTIVTNVDIATPGGSTITNAATVSSTTGDSVPGNNNFSTTTTVAAPAPAISINKVLSSTVDNDSSSSISTGDQLNYTVTAKNTGNVPLNTVTVSDDHFVATQSCPTLAPNATCVLTGSYIVTAADAIAGSVTNVGSVTSKQVFGPTTSTLVTPIATAADLSVTKTDSPDPVLAGAQLTYTITVHTAGPDSALSASLTDNLPTDLTFVSLSSAAGWSCTTPAVGANGTISCTNPQVDVGPDAVFTLVTTVSPTATAASINNTATVASTTTDPTPGNNSATASTTLIVPAPSLSVVKVLLGTVDNDGTGSISVGDQLNYQVTATNNGNIPLTGVVVSDDHFPATQSCPALATSANCVLTGSYIVTLADAGNGSVTNIGSATSNEAAGPFTSTLVTPIGGTADLSITKTDSPDPVAAGGQLTYTITVHDAGPGNAVQPVWTDNLPAQLGFVSLAAPAAWTCTTPAVGASGTVSCTRPGMGTTADAVFTLVTGVVSSTPVGSTITNTASVQSSTPDPNNANDSATSSTTVGTGTAALSVAKVLNGTVDNDNSGAVSAGDRLDYTVTATNSGNVTLTNVVVSDNHFAATQTCPTLAPAATCVLSGSYVVTAADASNGTITNVGSATSTEASATVSSSVITPIVEPATLAVGTGDGQTAEVNTAFADPLTVIANGSASAGFAAASIAAVSPGITINWSVVSGSAHVSAPSSVTNASGIASINAFADSTPGPVVIRAARADDPSVTADFHLTVVAPNAKLADLPGLTPNEESLAKAIDAFCSDTSNPSGNANLADLLARCQELIDSIATDPSGVLKALDELFADIALVQSESSLLAAESQFENIKARIAALRSGTVGTSFGGLAFNNASGRLPIGSMFQGLLAEDKPGETKEVGADFSRWGFFAAGTIGRGDTDQGSLSPAYDFDITGLTLGADYRLSDKLIFGGTLGLTKQTNKLTQRKGSLDTTGWSISGYGTWYQQNSWYMDGVASYGKNSYEVERHVHYTLTTPTGTTSIDQTGHAKGDGDSLTFALSVGRDFNKNGWGFGPYLRGMYTKMQFDPMDEEFKAGQAGSGLALELDSRAVTSLTSTLGAKLTKAHSTSWGVIIPHLQFEWQHEFETDPAEVEARFLYDPTGTPFTIHGDPVDTDFFRFGVGMSFVMTHGRSGFFYYERLISRERFNQNSLALGIRIEF